MAIKIVEFDKWCPKCKFWENREDEDPCWDCLNQGWNEDSHCPICYKEKENNEQKRSSEQRKVQRSVQNITKPSSDI